MHACTQTVYISIMTCMATAHGHQQLPRQLGGTSRHNTVISTRIGGKIAQTEEMTTLTGTLYQNVFATGKGHNVTGEYKKHQRIIGRCYTSLKNRSFSRSVSLRIRIREPLPCRRKPGSRQMRIAIRSKHGCGPLGQDTCVLYITEKCRLCADAYTMRGIHT